MIDRVREFLRRKFVRDTLALQIGKIGATALSMVTWVLTVRLLGFENYGVWKLVLSFFNIWLAFNLTGIGISTTTRLAEAIGRRDEPEILNLQGFYVKVTVIWSLLSLLVLSTLGTGIAARLYDGDVRVGLLAAWFALTIPADMLYTLVLVTLQSRRSMRTFAILQPVNQLVLTICILTVLLIDPTPESMVGARLVYSYSTLLLALVIYARSRQHDGIIYPRWRAIIARAVTVSPRRYWRFGVTIAFDKNLGNLFTQIPVQLVGVFAGETAAGYLSTALDGINRSNLLTSAVLNNLQAVIPQAVGRLDYVGLQRNFNRVLLAMLIWGGAFYGVLALAAPVAVPLLLGDEATPAVPLVIVLCLSGVVTTVGGIFGPLYRAFDLMRAALLAKIAAWVVLLPPGIYLLQQQDALGGAWLINGLFVLSVALTAAVTLPALHKRAVQPVQNPQS